MTRSLLAATLLLWPSLSLDSQQEPRGISGTWAGGIQSGAQWEPFSLSIAQTPTLDAKIITPVPWLRGKIRSLQIVGRRIRIEFDTLSSGMLSADLRGDTLSGETLVAGRTGQLRLIRVRMLDSTAITSLLGAYRFRNGQMLLVDRFHDLPFFQVTVTDPGTGQVRIAHAISDSTFVTGPSLSVPYPTQFTLTFNRGRNDELSLLRRSGTTVSEALRIPLRHEEVRFGNGEVTLAGTLLLPPGGGPHPAIVLTHASGPALREWYWGFAYWMAAKGVAVLGFDKRGVGQSSGTWLGASFEELADDAVAAAEFLKTRADINGQRIGFWGLSQGAWIAPLAAVRFHDPAFVVTLSGGALSPERAELLDSQWELKKAGYSEDEQREAIAFQIAKNLYMRTGTGWDNYAARRAQARPKSWFALPGTDLSGPAQPDHVNWARGRRTYFYDPLPTLAKLHSPLLAIFGELDSPDGVRENVAVLTKTLNDAGWRDFLIKVFPNGRHNLMDMTGATPNEYHRLTRFVPGLFDTMSSFILAHTAP